MNHTLIDLFDFLQSEKLSATELKCGDVAFINSTWTLILNTSIDKNFDNHGYNLKIERFDRGISYISPKHIIKIIKRDILDTHGIKNFIDSSLEEYRQWEEKCALEEEKERLEEILYLKNRLEKLTND
jgi:hypothetical protein